MPYNRSIMTRILFKQLEKQNLLVISHFTKSCIQKQINHHMNQQKSSSNIFGILEKIGMVKAGQLKKQKLTSGNALKILETYFKDDLAEIYRKIGEFR